MDIPSFIWALSASQSHILAQPATLLYLIPLANLPTSRVIHPATSGSGVSAGKMTSLGPNGDFSSIASGRVINEKRNMSAAEGLYGD